MTIRVEQLPVGVYKVTFDLSGFREYIRENIQITPGFSADVKVQMSVGAIEESITVSAAGPVVDTTSTTKMERAGELPMPGRSRFPWKPTDPPRGRRAIW
jgi:hypothetical protein